ncbi:ethanolamine ammonia-lyase subunit EutC [Brevibacillus choshinensis]|uniref:Ethanolamine ammonia-lyase small subunit n=1 Tax=Brevibacillus choshinensis TaxID=54911 RepID=A0ABX7FMM7_BRECH|nr:ethanolamine ammonia-lyase subunit EutC [Brevibacillus choshinensis]QRG67498.1 ethanolamine ammonia-lyase subunit EutC [Brevibacillus choshinensis]
MEQQLDFLVDKVVAELQKKLSEMAPSAPSQQLVKMEETKSVAETKQAEVSNAGAASGSFGQLPVHAEPERTAHVPNPKWKDGLSELLESTPARIGVWRTGVRPLTKTMLQLRRDHAAAVDAVYGEVQQSLLDEFSLFTVETQYDNTENYLKRPDMGRVLNDESVRMILERCQKKPEVQIVVSDGLSASAVDANLRDVLPSLTDSLKSYGLTCGTPFFVKGGRVASMDHIGELLQPEVLVLLIGERPGLVTAHSMSAYMCYRPRKGMVESERTVISNIHRQGTSPIEAGAHIGTILSKMLEQKASGVKLVL